MLQKQETKLQRKTDRKSQVTYWTALLPTISRNFKGHFIHDACVHTYTFFVCPAFLSKVTLGRAGDNWRGFFTGWMPFHQSTDSVKSNEWNCLQPRKVNIPFL